MKEITQETIGKKLTGAHERDAIHIAVMPVRAERKLFPGDPVTLIGSDRVGPAGDGGHLGIIDPFLPGPVQEGEQCWLFLLPNTITGLRHQWTHPVLDGGADPRKLVAEQWIREFAASVPLPYETIMEGAADMVRDRRAGGWGEYLCFGGLLEGQHVPDEFWPHYETMTGEKVAENHRQSFFTCSC